MMLATLSDKPFDDPDWVFEIKWDGYRALARKTKKVALLSRNNLSFNARFPQIVKELETIPGTFTLDGEIVLLDSKGRSRFQLLQNYENTRVGTPYYFVFDILSYQGKDLTHLTLLERKEILRKILRQQSLKVVRFSEHVEGSGIKLFAQAKKQGLEGIMAKRKDSPYSSSRSKDWLKIKCKLRQEVVIGGYTEPKGGRKNFGALLVGVYERGKLIYAGHVGGGFNEKLLTTIYAQLQKRVQKKCPFDKEPDPNSPVTWVKPQLVCEVAFAEWTRDGMMRQPIFQGMRIDKSPKDVIKEKLGK